MNDNIFSAKNILIGVVVALTVAVMAAFFSYLIKTNEVVVSKGDFTRYFPNESTKVVLYGNSTCHYCKNAREFLQAKSILFVDHNIDQSKEGAAQFAELKGDRVPLIIVGEEKITGFHEKELIEMIARNQVQTKKP